MRVCEREVEVVCVCVRELQAALILLLAATRLTPYCPALHDCPPSKVWKSKPEATLDDVESAGASQDAEVAPVVLKFEDVHQYQSVFKPLVRGGEGGKRV